MRIALACDHVGFSLKSTIRQDLERLGHEVRDFGAHNGEEAADYPDFALTAAKEVGAGGVDRAILICGSGIGMCIAANKIRGVRAAVLRDKDDAELSRSHNDANVACFGGRKTDPQTAKQLVEIFLATPFAGGRHERRVNKIEPT